jgi:Na+/proline symporter
VQIGPQALIWFGIAGGAALFALSALHRRFVKKDPQAIRSGAGFLLFVGCLVLFAVGALIAGLVSIRPEGS